MTDTHQPEPIQTPQVKQTTLKPSGLIPKNAQNWVIIGIGLAMILAIALSGNKASTSTPAESQLKPPSVVDPNEARIQEYRNRIDEDARRLAAEQQRLSDTRQAIGLEAAQSVAPPNTQHFIARDYTNESVEPHQSIKSPIEFEREKREYQSLFASNIALTYRKDEIAGKEAAPSVGGSGQPLALLSQNPYGLFPAAMSALSASQPQAQTVGQPSEAVKQEAAPVPPIPEEKNKSALPEKPAPGFYRIYEGTIIEAALTNRLTGAFSGPVNCLVTTDVYSRDGQHILIPRGSRVLGEANKVEAFGQERLAIAFHRLILPDGYSVRLDRMPGLDQAGETGLRDKVNNHYTRIFGMSIAIGALSGLTQHNTRYGLDASSGDIFRQGVSQSFGDSSMRILDKLMNILPTFTISEGHRMKIYLTADLDLPLEKGDLK